MLRCEQSATAYLALSDLGVGDPEIRFDVALCAEHSYRLTGGERFNWIDEDRVFVVGEDLDSGGHLVPVGWSIEKTHGRTEVSIKVETPSGKASEPIKFLVSDDEFNKWLSFLSDTDMDSPPSGASDTR